jgi:hypothetical protein
LAAADRLLHAWQSRDAASGKLLKPGRYEFPVVLVLGGAKHPRRRFSSIVVVNTGNNGWAVDKLP